MTARTREGNDPDGSPRRHVPARRPAPAPDHDGGATLEPAAALALDLQHVAGNNAARQMLLRFGSAEHRDIGQTASGGATVEIDLGGGEKLTHGEMVALAGDYFGSLKEMKDLAATPAGQEELRAARWEALKVGAQPSAEVLKRVRDRYYALAAKNVSHFSAGGTARTEYQRYHRDALGQAFYSGVSNDTARLAEARTAEAFGHHYLTDMFSAGHVRTPRDEIKKWYAAQYPDSLDRFISYAAYRITQQLDEMGDIPWYWPNSSVAATLRVKVRDLGGPAVDSFSLGDIVSLAFHNLDNKGLGVVSDVDTTGNEVPGGFRWTAKGDDRLGESQVTKDMVTGAVRTSLADIDAIHERGKEAGAGRTLSVDECRPLADAAITRLEPFRAERYIPRDDTSAGNQQLGWEWGRLNDPLRAQVDQDVKTTIAATLRSKAGGVPETIRKDRLGKDDPEGAIVLRVRNAFLKFAEELATQGIAAMESAMQAPASISDTTLDGGLPPGGVPDAGVVADAGAAPAEVP